MAEFSMARHPLSGNVGLCTMQRKPALRGNCLLLPPEVLTLHRQERFNSSDAPKKPDKPMEESLSSPENRVYKESVSLEIKIAFSLSTYWC